MTEQQTYTINSEDKGARLDVFLSSRIDASRATIQKQITAGNILINNTTVKKNYTLKDSDVVSFVPSNEQSKSTVLELPTVEILKENKDFIVVNKPSGVVVHPDSAHPQGSTLIDTLVERFPELERVGEEEGRPGVIHRLDKPVSGVMVIARTQKMYEHLKAQFQERTVLKKYYALVHDTVELDHDSINYSIARKRDGYMAAKTDGKDGREAHTEFDVISRYSNSTLLDITLKTGRTHQIRVHLLAYGHPLVGETIYMSKKFKTHKLNQRVPRVFLHAHYLEFSDLNNEPQTFEQPLPKELQSLIDELDK